MRIGLDFDNTIVCYDQAINRLAEETFDLPAGLPRNKTALRDYLRAEGREAEWTLFQGALYGPGMRYAEPFEGALAAIVALQASGHILFIISHRTLYPYAGPKHNLHEAAQGWVAQRLHSRGLLERSAVHFFEAREQKIAAIGRLGCDIFLDDLHEVLADPLFPPSTEKLWFNPHGGTAAPEGLVPVRTWRELVSYVESQSHAAS
jgi:hypothetical protein